jgi:hypothetical protein
MATTSSVTASLSSDIGYTFIDSTAGASVNEVSSLGYSLGLSAGTSTGQINAAVRYTGFLPAGGVTYLDFTGFQKPLLGGVYSVNFTDVKGVVVENQWNGAGAIGGTFAIAETSQIAYLTIGAPSTSGFTGLFNGGDGQVRISPQSTWMFNDRFGVSPTSSAPGTTNTILSLHDTSGSGIPVSVIVVGVTG